jgi:opacity protein-like surface antigen
MRLGVGALILALMAYPAVAQDWSGAYIGGFGAYEHATRDMSVPSTYNRRRTPDRLGWGAGGLAGYNWQMTSFVIGAELDLSWSDVEPRMTFLPVHGTQAIHTYTTFDYLASLRGRAGYASGPFLLYATGGLAWMQSQSHLGMTAGTPPNWGPSILDDFASAQHWGWVAGTGIEFRVIPNLARPVELRAEWLHYDFSSEVYDYTIAGVLTNGAGSVDTVRIAILAAF